MVNKLKELPLDICTQMLYNGDKDKVESFLKDKKIELEDVITKHENSNTKGKIQNVITILEKLAFDYILYKNCSISSMSLRNQFNTLNTEIKDTNTHIIYELI